MNLIITIIIILFLSFILLKLSKLLKISNIILLILGGILLTISIVDTSIIYPNKDIILLIGDIALIGLMFIAGLEVSWKILKKEQKDSIRISLFGSLIPLSMGFFVSLALGFSTITAAIIGICISITAEGTTAKLLIDLKKLKTRVGTALMGAGIIDDVIGLLFFILLTLFTHNIMLEQDFLIGGAIAAFFFGILFQSLFIKDKLLLNKVIKILNYTLIPFFFIAVGIHLEIKTLLFNTLIFIILLIVAMVGKLLGTFVTKPFTKFSWRQLYLIGWGMNSRGAVEMAIAIIAFKSNLISPEVYSMLIIITIITTLTFPIIMKRTINKYPKIMN